MALFENFPYTNLHELNLDWIISELNRVKDAAVVSVNGQTGDVILYQDPAVILPEIQNTTWSFFRMADGHERGITFNHDGNAFIMDGQYLHKIYTDQNSPDMNAQYIRLGNLTDDQMTTWNIFRYFNSVISGIQFDDQGSAYVMHGSQRYKVYTQNDAPPYPVTSVNGLTGAIVLYPDPNVELPAIDDPTVTYWSLYRSLNNGNYGIKFNDDGTIQLITPNQTVDIYTSENQPTYPVTSVNGLTGDVVLSIPDDLVTDVDDVYLDIATEPSGYVWGLQRTTDGGPIGIAFNNQNGEKAYLRYYDSLNDAYVEVQLLTINDIPSSAGVTSINGLAGVVTLYGSDVERTNLNNQTVEEGLEMLEAVNNKLAIVVDGNTSTLPITAGQYVVVINSTITSITDGLYKAANNVSANTPLVYLDLSTLSEGGLNDILSVMANALAPKLEMTELVTNQNLDQLFANGFYRAGSNAVAQSLTHTPFTSSFGMIVIGNGLTSTGCLQIAWASGEMRMRKGTSNGFNNWFKFIGTEII